MRIGFIVNQDVANINYRATGPAHALARAGHQTEIAFVQPNFRVDTARLRRCDVVHVYRLTNEETIAYVDDLRQRGIAVTWDNDDDIRLLPDGARKYTKITALEADKDLRRLPKLFRRIDLVTTTTETLADRFRKSGAPEVACIPNFPQPQQYVAPNRGHRGMVIGWVAGLEHHVDADALGIDDALARVLERHPDVRVVTIGVRLSLRSDRYEHHRLVQLPDLAEAIRSFDVGIAPIADLPFNHARSDIKIKEYAAAGVPWLASARGPYAGYGARQGGQLVPDDAWGEALESFVSSRLQRFAMRRRVTAWGKSQCIDRHVGRWVDAFEQAVHLASERRAGERAAAVAGPRR